MKVYIRTDLNMRKGKIASQASHAVTGVLLGAMEKTEKEFIFYGNNLSVYKVWEKNSFPIEIELVSSEEELLSKKSENSVLIKDAGRTEFGKPTYTCLGEMSDIEIKERINLEYTQDKPAKQILIANRDLNLTKWELAPKAALASWLALEDLMLKEEGKWTLSLKDSALKSWLLGAFAKITLKIEESNIEELETELFNNNIDFYSVKNEKRPVVLATSPQHFESIDPFTSNLKLY